MYFSSMRVLFPILLATLFCASTAHGQTLPCGCVDGSYDGVITNTDFFSMVQHLAWGDSIPNDVEEGPGWCDLDGDGTRNVHDYILFTSLQQQQCSDLDGDGVEEVMLPDAVASTFQGWVLEMVAEHPEGLGDIPAGAKTYRLFADFDPVVGSELRMMGLWGDDSAPWFIDAPGGLFVSVFSGAQEDVLPEQDDIDPLFFSVFPEVEYSSFWTVADMWSASAGFGNPYTFERSAVGQGLSFQSGEWSSEEVGGSGMLAVAGSILNERLVVDGLHLVGQFTVLDGQGFAGQAGLVLVANDALPGGFSVEGLMVVPAEPFDLSNLEVLGCTDETAINFDMEATYNDGSCVTCDAGDLDCDGVIGVSDLLGLLADFGCASDCGASDLDQDGSVNVADILGLLSLFAG